MKENICFRKKRKKGMIFDANEMNHLMGDINKQMNDKIDLIEDLKKAIMK